MIYSNYILFWLNQLGNSFTPGDVQNTNVACQHAGQAVKADTSPMSGKCLASVAGAGYISIQP